MTGSTVTPRPFGAGDGRHPRLYFGGASAPAEQVAATEADVQLFWGEPLDGIAERIGRLQALAGSLGRVHAPLEFGLRITTWSGTPRGGLARRRGQGGRDGRDRRAGLKDGHWGQAVGQQRLSDLAERGEVLDTCLYTAPGKFGGGGAGTTWLVGSHDEVAAALRRYQELGVTPLRAVRHPVQDGGRPRRRRAAEPAARPGRGLSGEPGAGS